ncbi:MAG: 30S ribosome-binding factor RbfA [Victivallales bacterium]|nr:30S ribosome-binding factor RbfA [Victivallales bacterium]
MAVDRVTKLNAQLQKEIGMIFEVLVRPEVPGALVTVTGVEIASNLRNANVFVSVYGSPAMKALTADVLKRKRVAIQNAASKKVVLKYTPVLNFKLDDTAERADRVMNILKDLDMQD